MPKPTDDFHWATTAVPGVDIIEPPDNKQDIGWLSQEKPPYQFFNYLFNVMGQWMDYVEEIGDAVLVDIKAVIPIGGIIGFGDFNAVNAFDTDVFTFLNGSFINDADSPMDGLQLPDASGRYLIGLGTDGGGDMGADAWGIAPVGNAAHQINLQHSHTVNAHSHDLGNHTHTAANHTHGPGTLKFATGRFATDGDLFLYDTTGAEVNVTTSDQTFSLVGGGVPLRPITGNPKTLFTATGSGVTAAGGAVATGGPSTNTSGNASPGTNNQLSTTQNIQPRSTKVRWIIRYK